MQEKKMNVFKEKISIRKEEVLRFMGQKGGKGSRRLSSRVDKLLARANKLVEPKVVYSTRKIRNIDKGRLEISEDVELKSHRLSHSLKNCKDITIFIATIGDGIDDLIQKSLKEKRITDAYIYDAIGSAAVEETVNLFQDKTDSSIKDRDQTSTLRFSPGYCDWQIQEQEKIFDIMNSDIVSVDLNDTYLMSPRKSVSGVFGIGESESINKKSTNPCRLCSRGSCIARREQ